MFIKSFFKILAIYIILFVFVLCLYYIINLNVYIFYIILTLILLIGIIIDNRFSKFRKILLALFLLFQYIVSIYLEVIPILFIKDLFWFSVVLNISFVWHYLILIWLYDFFKKINNQYWCYIISRISLLTSLSWINIILSSCFLLNNNIQFIINSDYYYSIKKTKYKKIFIIFEILKLFLTVLYKINNFFMFIFSNYSLLIFGKSQKIKFNKDLLKLLLVLGLFLFISFLINVPRLYIIWFFYLIKDLFMTFANALNIYSFPHVHRNFLSLLQNSLDNDLSSRQSLVINNNLLLKHEIFSDFSLYTLDLAWLQDEFYPLFSIYDINDLFVYDLDYRIKAYVKFTAYFNFFEFDFVEDNKELIEDKINRNFLNCSVKKYIQIYNLLKEEGYFDIHDFKEDKNLIIWNFIFGPKAGRYNYLLDNKLNLSRSNELQNNSFKIYLWKLKQKLKWIQKFKLWEV